jgi:glycosyltransferase involved in cell wall biosynthesis
VIVQEVLLNSFWDLRSRFGISLNLLKDFVLPSREESLGIAYLEAWMCGKPMIGGRIGSTQCVIDEGVDGLLANPDDAEDIALTIINLLSDRDMRERMARNGRAKTLIHYTWDMVTDKVEALYRDLIAAREMRQRSDAPWLKKYRIAP